MVEGVPADFVHFALSHGTCAVYLLRWKGKVVYVGKSTNVFARIAYHYQQLTRKRRGLQQSLYLMNSRVVIVEFDEVCVKPCLKADLDAQEIKLIQEYLPQRNILMKRPPLRIELAKLAKLPSFAKLQGMKPVEPTRRRLLPYRARKIEREFQNRRDPLMRVTLPKLKFTQDVRA